MVLPIVTALRKNFFNLFCDLGYPLFRNVFRPGEWTPRFDIRESEQEVFLQAENLGCDASHLSVERSGNLLTIKG